MALESDAPARTKPEAKEFCLDRMKHCQCMQRHSIVLFMRDTHHTLKILKAHDATSFVKFLNVLEWRNRKKPADFLVKKPKDMYAQMRDPVLSDVRAWIKGAGSSLSNTDWLRLNRPTYGMNKKRADKRTRRRCNKNGSPKNLPSASSSSSSSKEEAKEAEKSTKKRIKAEPKPAKSREDKRLTMIKKQAKSAAKLSDMSMRNRQALYVWFMATNGQTSIGKRDLHSFYKFALDATQMNSIATWDSAFGGLMQSDCMGLGVNEDSEWRTGFCNAYNELAPKLRGQLARALELFREEKTRASSATKSRKREPSCLESDDDDVVIMSNHFMNVETCNEPCCEAMLIDLQSIMLKPGWCCALKKALKESLSDD